MRRAFTTWSVVGAIAAAATACSPQPTFNPPGGFPAARVLDLGHPLAATDPTWSGAPTFARAPLTDFDKDGYASGKFASDEHFGTHVDAPAHFAKGGWTVDAIPPDRLLRPAVCINVKAEADAAEDYLVTVADITEFESANGRIPPGAIVLIATGWDARWPSPRYMNVRDGQKHFPGLSKDAALLLAKDRGAVAIGIDTPSIDNGPSITFESHRATQPETVYHIENAANLTTLPAKGFSVVVAPINIAGGSGGPTRIFALLPGRE